MRRKVTQCQHGLASAGGLSFWVAVIGAHLGLSYRSPSFVIVLTIIVSTFPWHGVRWLADAVAMQGLPPKANPKSAAVTRCAESASGGGSPDDKPDCIPSQAKPEPTALGCRYGGVPLVGESPDLKSVVGGV
ncbi:MAG: hypothetical protein WB987_06140 [Candidatus Acidiferrales bacterium]